MLFDYFDRKFEKPKSKSKSRRDNSSSPANDTSFNDYTKSVYRNPRGMGLGFADRLTNRGIRNAARRGVNDNSPLRFNVEDVSSRQRQPRGGRYAQNKSIQRPAAPRQIDNYTRFSATGYRAPSEQGYNYVRSNGPVKPEQKRPDSSIYQQGRLNRLPALGGYQQQKQPTKWERQKQRAEEEIMRLRSMRPGARLGRKMSSSSMFGAMNPQEALQKRLAWERGETNRYLDKLGSRSQGGRVLRARRQAVLGTADEYYKERLRNQQFKTSQARQEDILLRARDRMKNLQEQEAFDNVQAVMQETGEMPTREMLPDNPRERAAYLSAMKTISNQERKDELKQEKAKFYQDYKRDRLKIAKEKARSTSGAKSRNEYMKLDKEIFDLDNKIAKLQRDSDPSAYKTPPSQSYLDSFADQIEKYKDRKKVLLQRQGDLLVKKKARKSRNPQQKKSQSVTPQSKPKQKI